VGRLLQGSSFVVGGPQIMVSRYILVAVFSFFSLCALVVCVRTTLSFYLYASTVCVRTSLSFACVHPCVYWYPSSLSFFLWASVASVRTRTYLSLCLFLGYSVTCVCALIVFFILTSLPRVRTMTAFAIPTSLQRLTPLSLVYIRYGLLLRDWC